MVPPIFDHYPSPYERKLAWAHEQAENALIRLFLDEFTEEDFYYVPISEDECFV